MFEKLCPFSYNDSQYKMDHTSLTLLLPVANKEVKSCYIVLETFCSVQEQYGFFSGEGFGGCLKL